jgi:hypothetical protein
MARSSYIYVVQNGDGDVVAAFTVKHELVTWQERNEGRFQITRVRDGGTEQKPWMKYPGVVRLNPKTLDPAI